MYKNIVKKWVFGYIHYEEHGITSHHLETKLKLRRQSRDWFRPEYLSTALTELAEEGLVLSYHSDNTNSIIWKSALNEL